MRVGLVLLFLTILAASQNPSHQTHDDSGIHQLADQCTKAWNLHDSHAFAELFAEDADFTNVGGTSAHGRKAVEDFHAPVFKTRFKNSQLKIVEVRTRFISPSVASVDLPWEMTGATEQDGTQMPIRKGLLNWLVTNNGKKWMITVMHNQEFTPRKQ